jgi:D-aspartate ligase
MQARSNQSSPGTRTAPRRLCVVVAGLARNYGSVLGFCRSLAPRGVPVHVVVPNWDGAVLSRSRYCKEAVTIAFEDAPRFCRLLAEWISRRGFEQAPVLFPTSDATASSLVECREVFDGVALPVAPSMEAASAMQDKMQADGLARQAGLDIPLSAFASTRADLEDLADRMVYPAIGKPTSWKTKGTKSFKTMGFAGREELLSKGGEAIDAGCTLAVQQFIPGGDETVEVSMFYRDLAGQKLSICTGIKLRQSPPGAGVMAIGKAVHLPHVEQATRALVEAVDFRGMGGVEFKRHEGRSYFIEMSTRSEGFHPLAIRAGVDLPWIAYCDVSGLDAGPACKARRKAYWLDEMGCLGLPRSQGVGRTVIDVGKVLFSPSLRCGIWSVRDPGPFVKLIGQLAGKVISRRRGRTPSSNTVPGAKAR